MNPKILVVTGPSGFDKSSIIKLALKRDKRLVKSVSYTDRPQRPDEIDGEDFYFISADKFTRMIEDEKFIEWQKLVSNNYRYGKAKEEFQQLLEAHPDKIIVTVVNIVNVPVFARYYPYAKSVFIDVKDTEFLIKHLKNKPEVNNEKVFQFRLKFATEERRRRHLTNFYMRMQEDIEASVKEFLDIINKVFDGSFHT
jgi:guanylate kinase